MKMSCRHRTIVVFLIIATVSVFLFSCGIPTYWSPTNTTVISSSKGEGSELSFNVSVDFHSENEGDNAPNMGLLLVYAYSNSANGLLSSELEKKFNLNYRGTIPNGVSTVTANYNSPIWSFSVGDEDDIDVYAFTDAYGNAVSPYEYNLDITSRSSFRKRYTLKSASTIDDGVELYDNENPGAPIATYGFGLDSSNLDELVKSRYVHVYAAISAQGKGYSNLYWSNLVYIGSFDIQSMTQRSTTND